MHTCAPFDVFVKSEGASEGSGANAAKQFMKRQPARWVRVRPLEAEEKARIGAACESLIRDVLRPRFLPEIRPTQWNYPVELKGKWRGSKFSFITRYRSGWEDNKGEEFDSAWARFDHDEESVEELRFHIMWHRHTGQWFCLHRSVLPEDALRLMLDDGHLHPHI
jgi:hypothetical protein